MPDDTIAGVPAEDPDTSADEDFIDESPDSDASASEEDAPTSQAGGKRSSTKRKRDADLEPDSGDEAVKEEFRKAKKRKSKSKGRGKAGAEEDFIFSDEEGGEGGLIKTRRQRLEERGRERKALSGVEGATADVNAIWARLSAASIGKATESVLAEEGTGQSENKENEAARPLEDDEYITIKRTYDFAGEVKIEERRVLKSSAEAKLYLQSKAAGDATKDTDAKVDDGRPSVRRPPKRFSRFDPNPLGEVRGLPDRLQLRYPRTTNEDGEPLENVTQHKIFKRPGAPAGAGLKAKPADKINTVDKSRMDWAGFVDQEGLAEELDEYGKAKANYVDRSQFLARTEARREDEFRDARIRQQQPQPAA